LQPLLRICKLPQVPCQPLDDRDVGNNGGGVDNDDDVSVNNDDHKDGNGGDGGGGCNTATAAGIDTDKSTIN
jgi:hypothetical protein